MSPYRDRDAARDRARRALDSPSLRGRFARNDDEERRSARLAAIRAIAAENRGAGRPPRLRLLRVVIPLAVAAAAVLVILRWGAGSSQLPPAIPWHLTDAAGRPLESRLRGRTGELPGAIFVTVDVDAPVRLRLFAYDPRGERIDLEAREGEASSLFGPGLHRLGGYRPADLGLAPGARIDFILAVGGEEKAPAEPPERVPAGSDPGREASIDRALAALGRRGWRATRAPLLAEP